MADFYLDHPNLPSDKIAWWDFNAYQEGYTPGVRSNAGKTVNNYRDASAAACVASALLELSTYTKGNKKQEVSGKCQADSACARQCQLPRRTG